MRLGIPQMHTASDTRHYWLHTRQRQGAVFLVVVALVLMLAACAPAPGGPPTNGTTPIRFTACGSSVPLVRDAGPAPAAPTSFYLGSATPRVNGMPSGTFSAHLYALDPATGTTRWCDQFSNTYPLLHCNDACGYPTLPVVGQPTLAEGVLYTCVTALESELFALDAANGHLRWSHASGCAQSAATGGLSMAPTVADGVVYAGADALDAMTGHPIWTTKLPISLDAASGNLVYGCTIVGETTTLALDALDIHTGALRWQQSLDVITPPVVADGRFFVGVIQPSTGSTTFSALDATTGTALWNRPLSVIGGQVPPVSTGLVYVSTGDGLVAIDATTSIVRWSALFGRLPSPMVAGGIAYEGGLDGMIALDAVSGKLRWRWTYGANTGTAGTPARAGQMLAVPFTLLPPTATIVVFGLDATTGAVRWHRDDIGEISTPTAG